MKDNDCIRSDINILEAMVRVYEKRGGGHCQKEALNTAIKFLSNILAIKGSGVLPEKKECGCGTHLCEKCAINYYISETIDEISLRLAKVLSGLEKKEKGTFEEKKGKTYWNGYEMSSQGYLRVITKYEGWNECIDYVKSKLGLGED